MIKIALASLAATAAAGIVAAPVAAADITGAGSSFVAPLYAKWGSGFKAATGNKVNYQSIGSGGGQAQIKARTVDFGASDDPMLPADLAANGLMQFPSVIGSEVIIVNIPGIANNQLRLTPGLIAGIYQGQIKRWNDPAIVAINKGLPLRPLPITPVYRSDSSGTTAVFTKFMAKTAKNWKLGAGKTISWPVGSGGKGNEGVAGNVKNTVGAIGYVEYNYASANRLVMTQLSNTAGKFVVPSPASFDAAAAQANWATAPSVVVDMLALPGANTWPIVSPTYVIVPLKPTKPVQTSGVLTFFNWAFVKGGPAATQLGYLPLPPAAVTRVRAEWKRIAGVTQPDEGRRVLVAGGQGPGRRRSLAPVNDIAVPSADAPVMAGALAEPPRRVGYSPATERLFTGVVTGSGAFVLLMLGAIIVMLAVGAWPALRAFGPAFFVNPVWDSVADQYGAGIMIYGTLLSSVLALVIAVPLATGVAYFLTELLPAAFRQSIGIVIQLLAAIPSIIYGMWGFFVLAPWLSEHVILDVADFFVDVPVLNLVFGYGSGNSVFTAGLVLAVMILPLITAMFVEILAATPVVLKESVYGLGATRWEVVRNVAIPYGRRAMIGAIMLGLGRALGETMAVTFVIGNATRLSPSIFDQGSTIASTIASEFGEAGFGTLKLSALLGLGLTLFIISFLVLAASRALVGERAAS